MFVRVLVLGCFFCLSLVDVVVGVFLVSAFDGMVDVFLLSVWRAGSLSFVPTFPFFLFRCRCVFVVHVSRF